jgi:hypothetical protein
MAALNFVDIFAFGIGVPWIVREREGALHRGRSFANAISRSC